MGWAKCLAQDPACEHATWEMLRAEQEQPGEGALLVGPSCHIPQPSALLAQLLQQLMDH